MNYRAALEEANMLTYSWRLKQKQLDLQLQKCVEQLWNLPVEENGFNAPVDHNPFKKKRKNSSYHCSKLYGATTSRWCNPLTLSSQIKSLF